MTESLSARASLLRPSPTLTIMAKARQLKSEGQDIVSFGAGEPDFDTPSPVIEAAVTALRNGVTRYTPTPGLPALREAIAKKLSCDNGVDVTPEQVVVSSGAKQSLFNTVMTLVDPGDEVVVFAPYWMTYIEQVEIAGGVPVVVQARPENGFVPTVEDFDRAVGPKTKLVMLNSPSNPTGAVYPSELLTHIVAQAHRRGFWIASDEIYEKLVYGVRPVSPASLPDAAARTVTINGCSKSYAMTGWRIGYAAAPLPVAKAMSNLQDQVTSNATSFAQTGAIAALKMDSGVVESMRAEFQARRDMIVRLLNAIPGVDCCMPDGAFYVFPDVTACLGGKVKDDAGLAGHLLEDALVATVPGSVFGGPGHIRLSYAASREDIERGIGRIGESLSRMVL